MISLESYGDRLKKADYRCHSRFGRAVNFFNGHSLVALVDREIGPGPHHIIFSGLDPQKAERLTITASEILLDDRRFTFAASCPYDSRIDLEGAIDRKRFDVNLGYFALALGHSAASKTLTFLPGAKGKPRSRSALERSIAERLSAGSHLIFGGDFLAGIRMCKGLGLGLTPSGDDLIGGLLLALHCGQKIFRRDFSRAITSVGRLARGKNPFSNTMLASAGAGRAIGRIKDLLAALIYGGKKNVLNCTQQLRAIGHSSGIDFGTGLLLTFAKLSRNQGEAWW
jgi:hypothetical protein